MDDISKLLQEAAPLYHRRKRTRQRIRRNCATLAVVIILATPIIIGTRYSTSDIDTLYAELYSNDTMPVYYIDEFDAIGII